MRSERMAQGVASDLALDARRPGRVSDGALQHAFVHMMPTPGPRARVLRKVSRGKGPLPAPLPVGARVFPLQRVRQVDRAVATGEIFFVDVSEKQWHYIVKKTYDDREKKDITVLRANGR